MRSSFLVLTQYLITQCCVDVMGSTPQLQLLLLICPLSLGCRALDGPFSGQICLCAFFPWQPISKCLCLPAQCHIDTVRSLARQRRLAFFSSLPLASSLFMSCLSRCRSKRVVFCFCLAVTCCLLPCFPSSSTVLASRIDALSIAAGVFVHYRHILTITAFRTTPVIWLFTVNKTAAVCVFVCVCVCVTQCSHALSTRTPTLCLVDC